MHAKVFTCALVGLEGVLIEVEVDIASQGLPRFDVVGLPDAAVQEARERVRAAINTGPCRWWCWCGAAASGRSACRRSTPRGVAD